MFEDREELPKERLPEAFFVSKQNVSYYNINNKEEYIILLVSIKQL